ncbi:MAG TPA: hypothetical protein VE971_02580 [Candidatus Eisenbacteria bacterium]|nr:hypothetical protein [Candidatus Eisenbacteria bacterium]
MQILVKGASLLCNQYTIVLAIVSPVLSESETLKGYPIPLTVTSCLPAGMRDTRTILLPYRALLLGVHVFADGAIMRYDV